VAAVSHQQAHGQPGREVVFAVLQRARERGAQAGQPSGLVLEVLEVRVGRRARLRAVLGGRQADGEERRWDQAERGRVVPGPVDQLALMPAVMDRPPAIAMS
jgi:hypothetical protein